MSATRTYDLIDQIGEDILHLFSIENSPQRCLHAFEGIALFAGVEKIDPASCELTGAARSEVSILTNTVLQHSRAARDGVSLGKMFAIPAASYVSTDIEGERACWNTALLKAAIQWGGESWVWMGQTTVEHVGESVEVQIMLLESRSVAGRSALIMPMATIKEDSTPLLFR